MEISKLQTKKRVILLPGEKNKKPSKASHMKTFSNWILIVSFLCINSLNAKNLQANFQYFSFQNEKGQCYIETYLSFLSSQLTYAESTKETFQSAVLVELELLKEQESIYFDKYQFNSPELQDTLVHQNFIDKQIIALHPGKYTLNLKLTDVNSKQELEAQTTIKVSYKPNEVAISDIMLLEEFVASTSNSSLSKSGYDLVPSFSQGAPFFDDEQNSLNFYVEWYHTQTDTATKDGYLLNYYIENDQSLIPLSGFNAIKKRMPDAMTAHIGGFNLNELPSGNYNLVIALMDRKGNALLNKKLFFQRRNTKASLKPQDFASLDAEGTFVDQFTIIEELAENISSLLPIANQREWSYATNQLATWDLKQMRQFFYGFWKNKNPIDPESEWNKYYKAVQRANEMFSSNKIKGFATDRGRIFLKYGTATYIENSVHENHMLPYQVWNYVKLGKQTNRVFIFAETAMGTNDYELIHSDAQGEVFNANWKDIVYRTRYDVYKSYDIDFDKNNSVIESDFNSTRDENDNIINID